MPNKYALVNLSNSSFESLTSEELDARKEIRLVDNNHIIQSLYPLFAKTREDLQDLSGPRIVNRYIEQNARIFYNNLIFGYYDVDLEQFRGLSIPEATNLFLKLMPERFESAKALFEFSLSSEVTNQITTTGSEVENILAKFRNFFH